MFSMIQHLSILKNILFIAYQLKSTWDFLLYRSFYSNRIHSPEIFSLEEESGVMYYEKDEEISECSICLCKIEEGDEVRILKCDHLFHFHCLDRWLAHGRSTCPLCRTHVPPPDLCCFSSRDGQYWSLQ